MNQEVKANASARRNAWQVKFGFSFYLNSGENYLANLQFIFFFLKARTSGRLSTSSGLAMDVNNHQLISWLIKSDRKILPTHPTWGLLWREINQSRESFKTLDTRQSFTLERSPQSNWPAVYCKRGTSLGNFFFTLAATIPLDLSIQLTGTSIQLR